MQVRRAPIKRFLIDPLAAIGTTLVYLLFRLLPFKIASDVGGALGRGVGPRLPISRRARRNLKSAFPEKNDAEVETIVRAMWDNLGRVAGEYPHLAAVNVYDPNGPVEVTGVEHVDLLRDDGKPGIFISAHLANWELVSSGVAQRGLPIDRVYRAANNRLLEWLYRRGRGVIEGGLIPKGAMGARMLLKSLRDGKHLGIMVDQKMNDGIAVKFFGRNAMTSSAVADLALRFGCPVVPGRVVRLKGARFRIEVDPPLEFTPSGDRHADIAAVMTRINEKLESWIRATPEQWLWLHNRWPDD